ncbi:hypothetical protein JEQ12_003165 [Ovis aries]|uniref:Thioredoxin domain-containing protein 17 n=1 Tax=Ovis aries TaxID=9940 RepID=A0A835ZWK0_SHEEP|nr:hypothetical protein JEQ12_003165 [Ovis aries]
MASYEEVSVSGYEEFMQVVEQHSGKTIFAYFSGSKDAEGKSWCPDCVQDMTVLLFQPQKLVESECLQANLVEMLFSED